MSRKLDYSKWDHIEVSDDEDDMPSSFNRRDHQAGVKLVEQQKKGKQTQALQHEKKVHEITDQLKNSMKVLSKEDPAASRMQTCVDSRQEACIDIPGSLDNVHPTDSLYEKVCTMASLMLGPVTTSSKNMLNEFLRCWNEGFIGLLPEAKDILSLRIATTPHVVETLLTFADHLFSETSSKHRCLWSLNQTFALLSTTTPLMQQLLVENGLVVGVLLELEAFRNCPSSEDVIYLVQLALSILCNLLQVPANVAYFRNTECDKIVEYFTNSTDPKSKILSTSVLCYLEPKSVLHWHHLELKEECVKFMVDLVLDSISGSNLITLVSLLRALHAIVKISEINGRKFISQGFLSIIFDLMATHNNIVQNEVILILCTMASYSTIKSDIYLRRIMDSLKGSDLVSTTASICALWDIDEQSKDCAGYIAIANGCYQVEMFESCIKILQLYSSDSDIQEVNLLMGKSLFHLCNKSISKLPQLISPKDVEANKILNAAIEHATEAVNLLGYAHDHNCIDEEGSKYLDLCMMFLISSANALNKCQRCLLCLSNLMSREGPTDSSIGAKRPKRLQHSHVVPKAILEAFSSGLIKTSSRRLFRYCGTEKNLSRLMSPKESTWFLLCSNCEQCFGAFEERFVHEFFRKIYNVSKPTSPLEAQEIFYGCWLYQFCISMFFRGVAVLDIPCNDNLKRFRNSEKLYEIFVRCRQILLAPNDKLLFPSVHVLINSTSPTWEESQLYATMHEVLVTPEMLSVAAGKDSKKYFVGPSNANIFLAHIGIINIVIDVEGVILSKSHSICPKGGAYHVPHDNERSKFIPPDVKECFYTSARQMEVQKETIPDRLRKSHWTKGITASPPSDYEQTFMVHPAQRRDRGYGVRPSQYSSKVKLVNFLPQELRLVPLSGEIKHPPGHHILFHCEPDRSLYQGSSSSFDEGVTIFLAIGDGSKKYPADNPYAIYHKYEPGLQFDMAMFISKADLSVTKLITNDSPQHIAEKLFQDPHFRENIQRTLRGALCQMGFANFDAFLPYSQEKRMQCKCHTRRRCWYCINRCDNCMEVANFELTQKANGVIIKFCTDACAREFCANPKILNLLPAMFTISNDNGKVRVLPPAGHEILQHVTDHFDEKEEMLAASHTTCICVGDNSVEYPKDKVYITYTMSTALRHVLLAFFVTDDFSIYPLMNSPNVEVAMWFSKSIQHNIRSVLESVISQTCFSSFKAWRLAATQGI